MHRKPSVRRFVLLLALLVTLLVTTAAASPAHFHSPSVSGRCDVCVIAHLPALQPALSADLFPPSLAPLGVHRNTTAPTVELFHRTALSRGPPVLSSFAF